MNDAHPAPACPAAVDDATSVLQVRAFAWYLGAMVVGSALLWAVVPRLTSTLSVVSIALLPAVLAFDALSLVVLWRWPRFLRELHVAQYASFFPILLGYLAVTLAMAVDPAARQAVVASFAVWIPVVVVFSFFVFGSRDGLVAALAFVGGAAAVVAWAGVRGAVLDSSGVAYVAILFVASVALAALVRGTSLIAERAFAARFEAAVAAELALRDALTGVHSRLALEDRFDHELARSVRDERPLAVYFIDLNDFKRVNDTYGHATGDALLQAFAGRMLTTVRASDTVGRMGGDEFVVLASVAGDEEAHALAERMLAACEEPEVVDGRAFELSVSIGVAVHPGDGVDRATLLRAADAAMYAAKAAGRHRWAAHVRGEPVPRRDRDGVDGGAGVEGAHRGLVSAVQV